MNTDEQLTMDKLMKFYSHHVNMMQFLDVVVLKKKHVPLRVIDWFLTNYAKKYDIRYQIKRPNGTIETFKVYRRYRAELKASKKKKWDPFCRGEHFVMEYELPVTNEIIEFETAICQLNSFRWLIKYLVIDYILKNYDDIYEDMKKNGSQTGEKKNPHRKTELSKIGRASCRERV